MDRDHALRQFASAAELLPLDLRRGAMDLPEECKVQTEGFRLRQGWPPVAAGPFGEQALPRCEGRAVGGEDLLQVLEIASRASVHTVLDRVREGFVTVRGGHRVGLCGTAVVQSGEVRNLRHLSSLAVRIAKEVPGAAKTVLPRLLDGEGRPLNALILSPPGGGKTTLLRDLIRCISSGEGIRPMRVGVADERGELAALYEGAPQMEIGARTDVIDGCSKGIALKMLLRGMNPQVLAADEIGSQAETEALEEAAGCGVTLLCTAHGSGAVDLWRRPACRRLMEAGVFRRIVLIRGRGGERSYEVTDLEEGASC